jgi:hypothetical protein
MFEGVDEGKLDGRKEGQVACMNMLPPWVDSLGSVDGLSCGENDDVLESNKLLSASSVPRDEGMSDDGKEE